MGAHNATGQRGPTSPPMGSPTRAHLSPSQKVTGSHPAVTAGSGQHQPRTLAGSVTVSDGNRLRRTRACPPYWTAAPSVAVVGGAVPIDRYGRPGQLCCQNRCNMAVQSVQSATGRVHVMMDALSPRYSPALRPCGEATSKLGRRDVQQPRAASRTPQRLRQEAQGCRSARWRTRHRNQRM